MDCGYVALLDVLGFSGMVAGDLTGDKIRQYLTYVTEATAGSDVDWVVFSDSIVVSAKGDTPESFIGVAGACHGCCPTYWATASPSAERSHLVISSGLGSGRVCLLQVVRWSMLFCSKNSKIGSE